ncbi:hypothetical protein [Flavobacterium ustbae]|uniref:hypothetical protein n=1 Tax=Flavobacterium ustbae TaxID=2488790 RepID=UPI000F76FCD4|nr:hypothetical protein [Flavobacterium ustbae]
MFDYNLKSAVDLFNVFPDEQSCIVHLENLRWNGVITSPFDPDSKVYKCKNNKYRCKKTGKYFNVKTETIFDNSKISLQKWFLAIWILSYENNEISSMQLARDLDVTQKSAWHIRKRIKEIL